MAREWNHEIRYLSSVSFARKVHFQVLLAMAAQSGPLRFVEGIFKMSKPNGDSSLNDYFCQAFFLLRFVPRVSDC